MIKQKKWCARTNKAAAARRLRARIEKMIFAGFLVCTASASWAVCTVEPGYVAKHMQLDIGDIIIRDQAVGSVLAKRSILIPVMGGDEIMAQCPGWGYAYGRVGPQFPPNTVYPYVFDSNIPGIGLRLARTVIELDGITATDYYYPHEIHKLGPLHLKAKSAFKIEVIKTGPITTGGPLTMGRFTNYYTDGDGEGMPLITTTLSGRGITIKPAACTLDPGSKTIQVDMPKTTLSDFKGLGTAGPSKSFDIVLNCPDMGTNSFDIFTQIDTTNAIAGLTGVTGLTQEADVAQGIGILLTDTAGLAIEFAAPKKMGAHTGEAGQQRIGLQAAYFQVSDKPTAGAANGAVTFTMSYK